MNRKKVRRRSLEKPHGEESSTLENSQKNVEDVECETSLFWIEGGGGSVEQELGES